MPRDGKPYPEGTPEYEICEQLRELWGDRSTQAVGDECGVSESTARKWKDGVRCPDVSAWPVLAKVFGLAHWSLIAPGPAKRARKRSE